jgi:hypothetical protein
MIQDDDDLLRRPSLAHLEGQRKELMGRRERSQRLYQRVAQVALSLFLAAPFAAYLLHLSSSRSSQHFAVVALAYGVIPLSTLPSMRARVRDLETDIQQLDFQIDLFSHETTKREIRAEKLLRLNDIQLRRYYDLNLSQNRWIFSLGVGCIGLGSLIISASLYMVFKLNGGSQTTQVITAVLGAVGAILTNFVAAIYLRMNAATSENLAAFHSRLVETHQLMLGNLLASRIDDDGQRWDTLAALSLRLVPQKEDHSKLSGGPIGSTASDS